MPTSRRTFLTTAASFAFALLLSVSCSPAGSREDLDFHRGRNALLRGRHDWARIYFATDLERHPGRAESLRGLGISWLGGSEGSLSRAIASFEEYLQLVPDDAEIRLLLARARLRKGDSEGALAALAGTPETTESNLLRLRIHLNEDPRAEAYAAKLLASASEQYGTQLLAARLYFRLADDERAAAHVARAVAIDPLQPEGFYLSAQIERRRGELGASREALDIYELVRPLAAASIALSKREELQRLRALRQRLASEPLAFRLRLGRLLLETGELDDGVLVVREVAADSGCEDASLFELAQLVEAKGRRALAQELYQRILERDPGHLGARAQEAQIVFENNDRTRARRLLEIALDRDPHYAAFHHTLGLVELADGHRDAAVVAFRAAIDLAPWLAQYRLDLADVFLATGEREALAHLLAEAPAPDPTLAAYRRKHGI